MEFATIELWRLLPNERKEDPVSLKSFEMIVDKWINRALPTSSSEEYSWTVCRILDILYEIRKSLEENDEYLHCGILFERETKLFESINEPTA